jgi:hypothetical protein
MANIDRAAEFPTRRNFLAFTEGRNHPLPADYEPEPENCPGCGESVDHPLHPDNYVDNVHRIGHPFAGWHHACAEFAVEDRRAIAAERDAVLAMMPSMREARTMAKWSDVFASLEAGL